MRAVFVCGRETVHNGIRYLPGQALDDGEPAPEVDGLIWGIAQLPEPAPEVDGIITSSSRGFARWIVQPDRPQAAPPTREELEEMEADPYGLRERLPAPPSPDGSGIPAGKQRLSSAPWRANQEEVDDPYGLKSRAAEDEPSSPPAEIGEVGKAGQGERPPAGPTLRLSLIIDKNRIRPWQLGLTGDFKRLKEGG